MGILFGPVDQPPSKRSPGRHPHAAPDFRVKGRGYESGRRGGWDYTVENRGCVWATVAGAAAGLTGLAAIGAAAHQAAHAVGLA
jgi:hypothetical protein